MGLIVSGSHRAKDLGIKTEQSPVCNDFKVSPLRRGPWKISETVRALCPSLGLLSLFLASCYTDLHLHSSLQLTNILTWLISLHAHRHPEKVSNTTVNPILQWKKLGSFS